MGISYQPSAAEAAIGQILCILYYHVGSDLGLLCSSEQFQRRGCCEVLPGRVRSCRDTRICSFHESVVHQERARCTNWLLVLVQRVKYPCPYLGKYHSDS